MKIVGLKIWRFRLPLARPLPGMPPSVAERKGYVVELMDEEGRTGLGEVSPLPRVNIESSENAFSRLLSLRSSLVGSRVPDALEELSGGFERWIGSERVAASVRCGIETAVLNLMAAARRIPLRKLLSDTPRDSVPVNALLHGPDEDVLTRARQAAVDGFRSVKLKVGGRPLDADIFAVRQVRQQIGDAVALRLDANRAWDVEQAVAFSRQIEDCRVEYIEEPVASYQALTKLATHRNWSLPLALDESLQEIPPESLRRLPHLRAVVLKPTAHGFEKSMRFAYRAVGLGVAPVISSAFESGVGLVALGELAACVSGEEIPAGLDTAIWFRQDLLRRPFEIENGRALLPMRPLTESDLQEQLMEEVTVD